MPVARSRNGAHRQKGASRHRMQIPVSPPEWSSRVGAAGPDLQLHAIREAGEDPRIRRPGIGRGAGLAESILHRATSPHEGTDHDLAGPRSIPGQITGRGTGLGQQIDGHSLVLDTPF